MDVLLKTEDDIEVDVGDLVRYADVAKPADILTVQITPKPSDLANGLISEATPLAQALLGAVVGDEVPLHIPSAPQRRFRIIGITRSGLSAAA
jgi:transcription elongation GreA/GreB family factor